MSTCGHVPACDVESPGMSTTGPSSPAWNDQRVIECSAVNDVPLGSRPTRILSAENWQRCSTLSLPPPRLVYFSYLSFAQNSVRSRREYVRDMRSQLNRKPGVSISLSAVRDPGVSG